MTSKLRLAAITAIVAVLPLSACIGGNDPGTQPTPPTSPIVTTATPTPTPTPSPTWKCSSATGASCTQDLAEKEAARAKAYKDAEAAYRSHFALVIKAYAEGGSTTLPPELAAATGPEFSKILASSLKRLHDSNQYVSGDVSLKSVTPGSGNPEWPTTEIKLDACADHQESTVLVKGTNQFVGAGKIGINHATMRLVNGKWILWDQKQEVKPC